MAKNDIAEPRADMPDSVSRLEFGYAHGYTDALMKVFDTIEHIDSDLTAHKRRRNKKTYSTIIRCMIENRAELRDNPFAFVRCNDNCEGGFEVFVKKENELDSILKER